MLTFTKVMSSTDFVLCCRCEEPVDIEVTVTYDGGVTGRCRGCQTVLWHKEWFETSTPIPAKSESDEKKVNG